MIFRHIGQSVCSTDKDECVTNSNIASSMARAWCWSLQPQRFEPRTSATALWNQVTIKIYSAQIRLKISWFAGYLTMLFQLQSLFSIIWNDVIHWVAYTYTHIWCTVKDWGTYLNSLMKQKATYQERKTNSPKQVMPLFTKLSQIQQA